VGSSGVFRGERSGDCPAVGEEEKFFFALWRCVGGRDERREDVGRGRSCDWLEIGEIIKKGRKRNLHRRLVSVGLSVGEIFLSAPPETRSRPPGVTTLNETLVDSHK
jgi:hypothetical protein